jgi:hypothetical protein
MPEDAHSRATARRRDDDRDETPAVPDDEDDRLLDLPGAWEERFLRGDDAAPESLVVDDPALREALRRQIVRRKRLYAHLNLPALVDRSPSGGADDAEAFAAVGLAHGAAGIGLALYELHAATGRLDFLEAARRTFDREDTLFVRERGNWAKMDHPADPPRFEVAWCHGAAGIALARSRAAGLDPDRGEVYRAMARLAIATTLATVERGLASPRCDASPCHGMGGLIEIVGIAAQTLDDPSYRDAAQSASRILIDRHAESGDWPSGLRSGGSNPSLMLGDAGIGYTFLRLHDPAHVPSVLWIGARRPAGIARSPGRRSRSLRSGVIFRAGVRIKYDRLRAIDPTQAWAGEDTRWRTKRANDRPGNPWHARRRRFADDHPPPGGRGRRGRSRPDRP